MINWVLQMKKFYQSRKGHRSVAVNVMGNKIPLYGSGAGLSSSTGTTALPVPLKLSFVVRSRAYVLGKLVKPKFYKRIECDITFDPKKLNVPISLKKSCTYDWQKFQLRSHDGHIFFYGSDSIILISLGSFVGGKSGDEMRIDRRSWDTARRAAFWVVRAEKKYR